MFNQAAFNLTPFNRLFTVDVFGSFVLEGDGELTVTANVTIQPSFDLDGAGDLVFAAVRDRFGAFVLEGLGDLNVTAIRERYGGFVLQGNGELSFTAGRYHVDYIEFSGQFKPGDQIVLDSNALKMTLNGTNALHLMNGDFFDLNTGTNELIYTDNQTGRTVRIRVTYRDKFV